MKCTQGEHGDGRDAATVRVRYMTGAVQSWTTDMCDRHGTLAYERFLREGRRGVEVMPAGWTPAGDREARIRERVRDLLDEIASVELHPINRDPYPASVPEVADEIARYVLELEDGPARNVLPYLIERLREAYAPRYVHGPHLDPERIKRLEGAPEIKARPSVPKRCGDQHGRCDHDAPRGTQGECMAIIGREYL